MTEKHFDAILSKNIIAKELADYASGDILSVQVCMNALEAIEKYIGEANQPNVQDAFKERLTYHTPCKQ